MQENMAEKYDLIQDQLLKDPSILSVSESSFSPLSIGNSTWGLDWPGKDPQERILFSNFAIDGSYIETMGLTLVGGRTFDKTMASDTANIIINEAAARKMGFEPIDAVDQPITVWGERKGHIVGVIKDYNYSSAHSEIRPMFMMFEKDWCSYIIVRAKPQQYAAAVDALNTVYSTYAPAYPFEYRFLDTDWAEFYENEERTGQLFQGFAWLSIFISCLGLFGLAAFSIQQRTKEIGVRKVLGASTSSIITLTVKDFAILVILAAVLGSPLAWYLMEQWLTDFAFHVDISVLVPLAAMLLALVIAIVTVGFHSIRAARTNPVDALRYE
jgi:putative ABC transport system permease protein